LIVFLILTCSTVRKHTSASSHIEDQPFDSSSSILPGPILCKGCGTWFYSGASSASRWLADLTSRIHLLYIPPELHKRRLENTLLAQKLGLQKVSRLLVDLAPTLYSEHTTEFYCTYFVAYARSASPTPFFAQIAYVSPSTTLCCMPSIVNITTWRLFNVPFLTLFV